MFVILELSKKIHRSRTIPQGSEEKEFDQLCGNNTDISRQNSLQFRIESVHFIKGTRQWNIFFDFVV
jgi:hypothetical protein